MSGEIIFLLAFLFFVFFCICKFFFDRKENYIRYLESDRNAMRQRMESLEAQLRSINKPADENETDIPDDFLKVQREIEKKTPLIFVHGGAGTGKSTLIRYLFKKQLIHIKLAPTGLAALNIGGMTLHKFFRFGRLPVFHKNIKAEKLSPDNYRVLENAKVICIDEVSMVRADIIDAIDRSLRHNRKSDLPFAGYQMVFVGDLYQLPPVVNTKQQSGIVKKFFQTFNADCDLTYGWKSPWFLDADVLHGRDLKVINLSNVFRQHDQDFVHLLNDLRVYKNLGRHVDFLNKEIPIGQNKQKKNTVVIVLDNVSADKVNAEKIKSIQRPPIRFQAVKTGVFKEYDECDLPVSSDFYLKEKTFVMILYNDPNGQFVNGSTGIIQTLTENYADVTLKNGNLVRINPYMWESYKVVWNKQQKTFENVQDGTYVQMPLIPAYAITCHKAQGKTLDNIHLDFNGLAFAPGQAYVALSRVRDIKDISMARELYTADFVTDRRLEELKDAINGTSQTR